ncbi:hypothetical protein QMG61_08445 [Cryobacterium sp. PH31-AA6]|nr:hypothetical protein [Cryobacterium sp. PH31-AA6]MDJ0323789.1 hypothetical protein [Cryobacterium sp. PH31-AA6]
MPDETQSLRADAGEEWWGLHADRAKAVSGSKPEVAERLALELVDGP